MLNITGCQGNTNQNHNKISPPTCQNGHHQKVYRKQKRARKWKNRTLVHCWWVCKLVQPLWEKSMEASQNIENRTMTWSSNSTPGCVSGKKEQTLIWKKKKRYIHPSVHSSIIYNSQDTEATRVSQHQWVDKEDVAHTYIVDYYSAIKRMK